MNEQPLVSIGIPTFNRPKGLRKTLIGITRQTYKNLEVIVSDNCSPGDEVNILMKELCSGDSRITFYRQTKNLGPTHNFKFVLEKAAGDYFMWAADDDKWLGDDFLSNLMTYAPLNILTFPDAVVNGGAFNLSFPLQIYENCESQFDYCKAFCSTGSGYPFYGIYNLPLFNRFGLRFQFDTDMQYYNEGTFLHKLFLAGPVKYVKDSKIEFSDNSNRPFSEVLLESFFEYFRRTILIYINADLPAEKKTDLVNTIFRNYTNHIKSLMLSGTKAQRFSKKIGIKRLKGAVKFLTKRHL
jgi:glycosyltransferase involved in cell wall biosynthesis